MDLKDIEAADWSLTPGRYVGVAPPEEDEDFDFEQTLRDIHTELADLNKEAMELAAKIQENFEELGAMRLADLRPLGRLREISLSGGTSESRRRSDFRTKATFPGLVLAK